MERNVGIVLLFLLFCLSFAFTHGNPYNLNGTKTDACLEPSEQATAKCLQGLIECYSGPYFTKHCLEFPQILAESRCTGSLWDRFDPKKINPDIAMTYWAMSNATKLFHEPPENCSISKYIRMFGIYHPYAEFIARLRVLSSIPLSFSTSAIV